LQQSFAEKYPSAASFFRNVCGSYDVACLSVGGEVRHSYLIGGHRIGLHFAGPALIPSMTKALEHLAVPEAAPPELTVCLWDSATTGVRGPALPFNTGADAAKGEIWSYDDEDLMIISQPACHTVNMLSHSAATGVYWVGDAAQIPYHDHGSPLRLILRRWMSERHCLLAHGAAVGLADGGVLLTGRGGCGKSTTALACLNSPLLYAGDDYCLIAAGEHPHIYSLYNTGKQNGADTVRFPDLMPAISSLHALDNEKALYFLHDLLPAKMTHGFPLRALLIPHITGHDNTTVRRVSPAEGLKALAPTTVYQLPVGEQRKAIKMLGRLVQQLPNFILGLGTDITRIPDVILAVLSDINEIPSKNYTDENGYPGQRHHPCV